MLDIIKALEVVRFPFLPSFFLSFDLSIFLPFSATKPQTSEDGSGGDQ